MNRAIATFSPLVPVLNGDKVVGVERVPASVILEPSTTIEELYLMLASRQVKACQLMFESPGGE